MICRSNSTKAPAFTLMEVMLALAVSAIVLAAMGGVFFSAMRLRDRTVAMVDEAGPLQRAITLVRRDLRGAVPPGGVLQGDFKIGPFNTGLAQGFGLQLFTSTATISDDNPWGDIQEVAYELRTSAASAKTATSDLVRTVTHNLLASGDQDVHESVLLNKIQKLEFAGFDGTTWRDSWDTSLTDTNLPTAVRVRIQLASDAPGSGDQQPFEIVVPMVAQGRTNQLSTTTAQ